ncbi:MAG: hypothetical protein HRT35_16265 [Algicola sp.]|nr:hypothetical protein [Algicola sp.]
MRRVVKLRLSFIVLAICCYTLGFQFIPESLSDNNGTILFALGAGVYFIGLPLAYWFLVIKGGEQKLWRILIVFGTSSLMARYSFPTDVAQYFEFITWLRYPIIAVLLIIELVIIYSAIKGVWQARKLKGDPRISILDNYPSHPETKEEAKRSMGIIIAYEPASWYYLIPLLSRNHPKACGKIALLGGNRWHWYTSFLGLSLLSGLSYYLLAFWSETFAIVISSIIFYSIVAISANHRVCRHYTLYQRDDKLVINYGLWAFLVVDFKDIKSIEAGSWAKKDDPEQLIIGRGGNANVELHFNSPQTYFGAMGQLPEQLEILRLKVDDPQAFVTNVNHSTTP